MRTLSSRKENEKSWMVQTTKRNVNNKKKNLKFQKYDKIIFQERGSIKLQDIFTPSLEIVKKIYEC